MNIDKLKEANDKLTALLKDPHEGLSTWYSFLIQRVWDIVGHSGVEQGIFEVWVAKSYGANDDKYAPGRTLGFFSTKEEASKYSPFFNPVPAVRVGGNVYVLDSKYPIDLDLQGQGEKSRRRAELLAKLTKEDREVLGLS